MVGSKQANNYGNLILNSFKKSTRDGISESVFKIGRVITYFNSKLMNSVYTLAKADELKAKNSNVTINIAFPGLTQTSFFRHTSLFSQFCWKLIGFIFFKYPVEGAQSILYCAASAEVKGMSGKFISTKPSHDFK